MSISLNSYSQFIGGLDDDQYRAKVKLIDQFFSRFNGQEERADIKVGDRLTNMLMLLDLSQYKSREDKNFIFAESFVKSVIEDSITLHYSDSLWFAKVLCKGKLQGKDVTFTLVLNVEERKGNRYKWVIRDAIGNIFKTPRYQGDGQLFILPNNHEQFFMSLDRITSESNEFIEDYMCHDYETDALSAFVTLVKYGYLKISHVEDVEFTFLQVPGYSFSVKHFERDTYNSGWLISSVESCTEEEKEGKLQHSNKISKEENE